MSRSLLRSFIAAVAVFVLASGATAQTQDTNFRRFSIGPYFMPGASVFSGDVPHTWKTDLKFAWSAGVMSTFATSPKFALNLALAYDTRNIYFFDEDEKSVTTQMSISTFDIYAGAKFNDFMIGFDLGFPMAAEMTLDDGAGHSLVAPESHFSADSIAMKVDICIGAIFNIVESETGKFQFMIKAAYPLTSMWENTPYASRRLMPPGTSETDIVPQRDEVDGNTRQFENGVIPSLQLGFAYQFNLGGRY